MKNKIIPSIVLTSICLIVALLLGVVNMVTYDAILAGGKQRALKACRETYKNSEGFVDLSDKEELAKYESLSDPSSLWRGDEALEKMKPEVYAATAGGYVIQLTAKGYKDGMVVACAIDRDGKIVGTKCRESNETYTDVLKGLEGNNYAGMTYDTLVKFIPASASTKSKTSEGYYNAIQAAFKIFEKLPKNDGFKIIVDEEGGTDEKQ